MLDSTKLKKLARLARIEILPEDEEKMLKLLNNEIAGVKTVYDIDTNGLEALINPYDMFLGSQKDEVRDGNRQQELEKCSPKSLYGYYAVPKIIEN